MPMPIRSTSAGSTPTHTPQDCLAGVGGDVLEAFAQGESGPAPEKRTALVGPGSGSDPPSDPQVYLEIFGTTF